MIMKLIDEFNAKWTITIEFIYQLIKQLICSFSLLLTLFLYLHSIWIENYHNTNGIHPFLGNITTDSGKDIVIYVRSAPTIIYESRRREIRLTYKTVAAKLGIELYFVLAGTKDINDKRKIDQEKKKENDLLIFDYFQDDYFNLIEKMDAIFHFHMTTYVNASKYLFYADDNTMVFPLNLIKFIKSENITMETDKIFGDSDCDGPCLNIDGFPAKKTRLWPYSHIPHQLHGYAGLIPAGPALELSSALRESVNSSLRHEIKLDDVFITAILRRKMHIVLTSNFQCVHKYSGTLHFCTTKVVLIFPNVVSVSYKVHRMEIVQRAIVHFSIERNRSQTVSNVEDCPYSMSVEISNVHVWTILSGHSSPRVHDFSMRRANSVRSIDSQVVLPINADVTSPEWMGTNIEKSTSPLVKDDYFVRWDQSFPFDYKVKRDDSVTLSKQKGRCSFTTDSSVNDARRYDQLTTWKEQESLRNSQRNYTSRIVIMANSGLPLVTILDFPCSDIEEKILHGIARVKACEVYNIDDLPQEVLDNTVVCLLFHLVKMDESAIKKFPKLKGIVRYGTGFDNVALKMAAERDIIVCNVPAFAVEEVADSTMAHILQLYRRTEQAASLVRKGQEFTTIQAIVNSTKGASRIRGSVLGIVGLGRIGMAVAERAKPFGFDIHFYDPYLSEGVEKAVGVAREESLEQLAKIADCLTLHCPMDVNNRRMINASIINHMKQGAYLVNTSRGGLIDEQALLSALKSGKIAGAATDVHENEPHNVFAGSLANAPNLTNCPHSAFYSEQSVHELRSTAASRAAKILSGKYTAHSMSECRNRQFF